MIKSLIRNLKLISFVKLNTNKTPNKKDAS